MQKLIRVNIGGREYSLRGDDEEIINKAAEEVNKQLESIKGTVNEPPAIQSLLVALNIAEQHFTSQKQKETDFSFLNKELDTMYDYMALPLLKAQKSLTNLDTD